MKWDLFLRRLLMAIGALLLVASARAQTAEQARWSREASETTVVRDDWGIAHIHGRTDADAVFGMIYAQCEDDFNRVETNYLVSLGRLAEAEGEQAIWQDLRQRLFVDPDDLKTQYASSPVWLKALMDAWADGLNFYLARHPEVKPRVMTHFEPWMALSFTEGSIGGDIERVNLSALRGFYDTAVRTWLASPGAWAGTDAGSGARSIRFARNDMPAGPALSSYLHPDGDEPGGSNGFAIAPANTASHHALLLINPHTSFFFRSELQMTSDEGLNAYGAVTWGQLFVYQGFNERAGWMHTSSNVDAADEYREVLVPKPQPAVAGAHAPAADFLYRYGTGTRGFTTKNVLLHYRTANGMAERRFTVYFSQHGPVVRKEGDSWITYRIMNTPVAALEQSFLRTKAHTYAEYKQTMQLKANSSNNTIFADADGDIAYWHGNFIPRRDTRFDFTRPVDGSNPATEWGPLLSLEEIPHLLNPKSGYVENVNNWPWSGAGVSSLRRSDFPAYVEKGTETARGLHAVRVLEGCKDFTLDSLLAAAFDPYLPWFARTVPVLVKAYDGLPANDPRKAQLAGQVSVLRAWDFRWSTYSVATSLAVYWGEAVGLPLFPEARRAGALWEDYVATHATPDTMLAALAASSAKLTGDFGEWQMPWGEINRFQRLNDNIQPSFSDAGPSIPVPFTSSQWGSLASFAARAYPNTRKRYGTSGNSFVAVVEFGPQVRARAVTAGGESGHPGTPHFDDEAVRYASGNLRDVYFYPAQLAGHTERTYHPGDEHTAQ